MKKQCFCKTTNQKLFEATLQFYESKVQDKSSIKLNTVDTTKMFDFTGLSADHYEFLKRQIGVKKYSQHLKYRYWLDSKRKQHQKDRNELLLTVKFVLSFPNAFVINVLKLAFLVLLSHLYFCSDPLNYLNRIKESQLEQLHNAELRVDQAFRHGILLATIPSTVQTMNDVFMGRIQRYCNILMPCGPLLFFIPIFIIL
jgi:hypothetical protein